MKKNIDTSEHYSWGNQCAGWHLVKTDTLSVIQETIPPNTSEKLHYHTKSQQFFYVLEGNATIFINNESISLKKGDGCHVVPGTKHQIQNNSHVPLHFLVISEPFAQNDRIEESF